MSRMVLRTVVYLSVPTEGDTDERDLTRFVRDAIEAHIRTMEGDDEQPRLESVEGTQTWETIE